MQELSALRAVSQVGKQAKAMGLAPGSLSQRACALGPLTVRAPECPVHLGRRPWCRRQPWGRAWPVSVCSTHPSLGARRPDGPTAGSVPRREACASRSSSLRAPSDAPSFDHGARLPRPARTALPRKLLAPSPVQCPVTRPGPVLTPLSSPPQYSPSMRATYMSVADAHLRHYGSELPA